MTRAESQREAGAPGRLAGARAWLGGAAPSLLAGAALAVTASELVDPGRFGKLSALAAGAGYGLLLRILVRAFPGRPRLRPLAGLLLGALPFALFGAAHLPYEERLGLGLGLALLGALVGLLEQE